MIMSIAMNRPYQCAILWAVLLLAILHHRAAAAGRSSQRLLGHHRYHHHHHHYRCRCWCRSGPFFGIRSRRRRRRWCHNDPWLSCRGGGEGGGGGGGDGTTPSPQDADWCPSFVGGLAAVDMQVAPMLSDASMDYAVISILVLPPPAGNPNATPQDHNKHDSHHHHHDLRPPLLIHPGCILVPKDDHNDDGDNNNNANNRNRSVHSYRGLWDTNSQPLWNSLALLSDVVVIILEAAAIINDDEIPAIPAHLLQALMAGFRQRLLSAELPKGRLLILVSDNSTNVEDYETTIKQRILGVQENRDLSDLLDQVMVARMDHVHVALRDIVKHRVAGVSSLIGATVFPELVRQVFHSKGGDGDSPILQELVDEEVVSSSSSQLPPPPPMVQVDVQSISQSDTVTMTKDNVVDTTSTSTALEASMASVQQQLDAMQIRQEESWLDPGSMPMDFAAQADPILDLLEKALEGAPVMIRSPVERQVGDQMRSMYQQYLQMLRDYYGRMYEFLLDEHARDPNAWGPAAERVTDSFRQAAQGAVPRLAREGQIFRDMDLEYVGTLAGLVSDMMEATDLRQVHSDGDADEGASVDDASSPHPKRVARWYEKLAARALVLAVNYLQGWFAYQGVQRAAVERERAMPKFPLL